MANVSFVDGHIDEPNGEKRCKYCGGKLPSYAKICANCYEKLRFIRKIKALLDIAKEREEKQ